MISSLGEPLAENSQVARAPRPLMSASAVMWRLDIDEDKVLELLEFGDLLWGFNIAGPGVLSRDLRILTESVEDLAQGRKRPYGSEESERIRVAALIFPPKPVVVTGDLCRALNCGRTHILNLVRARCFRLQPGTRFSSGPHNSAKIVADSVKEWLFKRRVL